MTSNRRTRHPGLESPDEVKESLEIGLGRRGQDLDRWVTFRDLKDGGIANIQIIGGRSSIRGPGSGGPGDGSSGPFTPPDFGQDDKTRPPAPTGVRANGLSLDAIGVTWNEPGYNNHAYAEVFASSSDNWPAISRSFNPNKPVGPGNRPQNFMGTAGGTLFVHRNLSSTVPTVSFERPILGITMISGGFQVTLDGDAREFASVGDTGYFSAPGEWAGNGIQGEVSAVNYVSSSGFTLVSVDGPTGFDTAFPADTVLALVKDEDDLEQALNPQTIYYWVRFVSTAEVVGPVQSEAGVPGTVMLNPEEVLNILTGRIRSSQLASDIVTPINFIRGPITELDGDGNRRYPTVRDFVLAQGEGLISEYDEVWQQVIVGAIEPGDSGYGGIAAAAGLISEIEAEANANGAYIEALTTLQAAFDDGTVQGVDAIVSTITDRALVQATDEGAISLIEQNVQVEMGEDTYALNQIGNQVLLDHQGRLYNSITLKAQQNQGGILYAAGFGIGLEEDDDGEIESTVAFAADQFAIMSAANKGRIALRAQSVSSSNRTYTVVLDGGTSASSSDGLPVDAKVAITVPVQASQQVRDAFQGKTFKVLSRSLNSFTNEITMLIEEQVGNDPPGYAWLSNTPFTDQNKGVAVFPEQSIPFIVNTTVDPPVVGIRGRLIVDGMITATDVEVTELLRANEIWAQNITAFGLVNTSSLVGETIATPRFGGWAVKMTAPDTSFDNRVFEFSRWLTTDDQLPDSDDPEDWIEQENNYPQLRGDEPADTSFWLDAQGHAYLRGHLTVGGNARFWTGSAMGNSDYLVQIDNEFPISVVNKGDAISAGFPDAEGASVAYTSALKNWVRANALFWVDRAGLIGFNTDNNAVFAGSTPLEPPSGHGYITVLSTLQDGAPTGKGRIHLSADFALANNQETIGPGANVGCTIALYLVDAATDYGKDQAGNQLGYCYVPEDFNGTGSVDIGWILEYMNTHFLIIQAESSSSDSPNDDPGYDRFKKWEAEHATSIIKFKELWHHNKGSIAMSASRSAVASGNYRYLVVIANRYYSDGTELYGSPPTSDQHTLPYAATSFVQQVSGVNYSGPSSANSGSGGGGGGAGDGGGDDGGGGSGGGGGGGVGGGEISPF